jgi:hypothetical protein
VRCYFLSIVVHLVNELVISAIVTNVESESDRAAIRIGTIVVNLLVEGEFVRTDVVIKRQEDELRNLFRPESVRR